MKKLVLLFGMAVVVLAQAETRTWSGGLSGNFNEAANWGGVAPVSGDTLVIPTTAGQTVELVNDIEGLSVEGIRFTGMGAASLSGKALTLRAPATGAAWESAGVVTCTCPLVLGAEAGEAITVSTVATNWWDAVVSGPGKLVKTGAWPNSCNDRLILTQSNTYTGGTEIKYGYIEIRDEHALGQDTEKEVFIDAKTQDMVFSTKEAAITIRVQNFLYPIHISEEATARGTYSTAIVSHNVNPQIGGVTFKNRIYGGFLAVHAMGGYGSTSTQGVSITGPIFDGPIDVTGMQFIGGEYTFNGTVTNRMSNVYGAYWGFAPTLRFCNAANDFNNTTFPMEQIKVVATAPNALRNARFTLMGDKTNLPGVFLSGNDQTIDRIGWYSDVTTTRTDDNTQVVHGGSGTTATLEMRVTGSDRTNARFAGKLNLVWNPTNDFEFTVFSNRTSNMAGVIDVRRGTFRIRDGHTFKNVTKLLVGTNATFVCDTTLAAGALVGVTEVVLAKGGTFKVGAGVPMPLSLGNKVAFRLEDASAAIDLPADAEFDPKEVRVGEDLVEEGDYTSDDVAWLKGGTLHVPQAAVTPTAATWTGASGTTVRDAGNWSTSPALPAFGDGSLTATFASGGTEATFADAVRFAGIVLAAPDSAFTFSAANGDALVRIGAGGISCADAAKKVYTFNVPIRIDKPQTWTAGEKSALVFNGRLTAVDYARHRITIPATAGTLTFNGDGTSDFLGTVSALGNVTVTGTNALGRSACLDYYGDNGGEDACGAVRVGGNDSNSLTLRNAVLEKQVILPQHAGWGGKPLYSAAGTNEIRGCVTSLGSWRVLVEANTRLVLSGGFRANGTASGTCYGVLEFAGKPYRSAHEFAFRGSSSSHIVFSAPSNTMTVLRGDYSSQYGAPIGGVDLMVADAFASGTTALVLPKSWNASGTKSTVDLHGCDQHFGSLLALGTNNVLRSTESATLYLNQTTANAKLYDGYPADGGRIEGALSLSKGGSATLTLYSAHTSTGAVTVTSGTLAFASGASWLNGTTVAVDASAATATLAIAGSNTFGRKATVTLTDGAATKAKIDLSDGVVQSVKQLFVNGTQCDAGTWGATGSGATHVDDDHFSGTGVLNVRGGGLILLFR